MKTFSKKIDINLKDKLRKDLEKQGFSFYKAPYSFFSAKKPGIICTLYTSGTLVVQGKNKDEFIEFYLEPEILKSFEYTHKEAYTDMKEKIGVDESGKGDFFGPLCICSLHADDKKIKTLLKLGVKDSKKISDKSILKLSKELKKSFFYSSLVISPKKYNELYEKFHNLNYLLAWAHAKAIENLLEKVSCKYVIVDQFAKKPLVESIIKRKKIEIELKQMTKAESDPVVAAASIIARANFLEALENISKKINFKLLKGASDKVIELGIKIAKKEGKEIFSSISKTHFKTFNDILKKID